MFDYKLKKNIVEKWKVFKRKLTLLSKFPTIWTTDECEAGFLLLKFLRMSARKTFKLSGGSYNKLITG